MMGLMIFSLPERHCIFMNKTAKETLEIPSMGGAETPEFHLERMFPDGSSQNFRALSEEVTHHDGFFQDLLLRKTNDMTLVANVGVKHLESDNNEPILLLMFQDITLQKKLQREVQVKQNEIHQAFTELLQQNKQLKELDHAKDKFIALTTHELRTPLSAIVATAEVLVLKLYDDEKQKDEFIQTIYEQGLHLMELVNDVLDFAKIRAGKMDYFVELQSLLPILETIGETYEHMADQAKVKLVMNLPRELQDCYFDSLRMREVINNVVSNSIKYNRPNGEVRVSVGPYQLEQTIDGQIVEKKMLRLTIEDTGQGIPPDKAHAVFNEFETVGNVSKHHKGTGLGMPISRRLMQAMGGDLSFESEVGVGSKFFIDIPLEKILADNMYGARPDRSDDLAA